MKVLMVCTGNTCRSPMAEIILREELARAGIDGVEVASAGVMTWGGDPISHFSSTALMENGYDGGESFRSRPVDYPELHQWDLILTMTRSHRTALLIRRPELESRVRTLRLDAQGAMADIEDPFGGPEAEYREALRVIRNAVMELIEALKAKAVQI